ncbi:hypothetical protein JW711_03560 [Candidatus Woesearchaeota archaeon]|nr:hypothetical protein [Candidatus Woesearchaeota archaeon]
MKSLVAKLMVPASLLAAGLCMSCRAEDYVSKVVVPVPGLMEAYDNPVAEALHKANPDKKAGVAYLLDISGSMSDVIKDNKGEDVRKIDVLKKFPFPVGADVYVFSGCAGGKDGMFIEDVKADCGTPMLTSINYVMGKKPYEKVITLTDGANNEELVSTRTVLDYAKQNGVKLSFVPVGVSTSTQLDLERIAQSTGGEMIPVE